MRNVPPRRGVCAAAGSAAVTAAAAPATRISRRLSRAAPLMRSSFPRGGPWVHPRVPAIRFRRHRIVTAPPPRRPGPGGCYSAATHGGAAATFLRRTSMRPLSLALLGPFRARLADGRALPIRRRKSRALLAYLGMRPDEPQPREKLIALLWTDADADRARHSLRQTLTALRQDLAPLGWADAVLAGEALSLDPTLLRVDVADFERLARGPDLHRLERAAAAYRGDFLEGLVAGEDAFETWLAGERDRLRGEALGVLDRLVTVHVAAGAPAEVARAATRLLVLDPLREDVHRLLMRLHAREGRRN